MTLDKQIRNKCEEIILLVDSKAVVYPFDTLSLDPKQWAGLFEKSNVGHGWVIKRSGFTSKEIRGKVFADSFTYDLWGFYRFRAPSKTDNSDDEFQEIIDKMIEEFKLRMTLELSCVKEHKLPQFPKPAFEVVPSGKFAMHFAKGSIQVDLCERIAGAQC